MNCECCIVRHVVPCEFATLNVAPRKMSPRLTAHFNAPSILMYKDISDISRKYGMHINTSTESI
jgi:hypothetical protein